MSMMARKKELEDEYRRLKNMSLEETQDLDRGGGASKKVVRPSRRWDKDHKSVTERGVCIRVAWQTFGIIESCYRYESKLDSDNAEMASWLMRLIDTHRGWGVGMCFLYMPNVKTFKWIYKCVYRVTRSWSSICGSSPASC